MEDYCQAFQTLSRIAQDRDKRLIISTLNLGCKIIIVIWLAIMVIGLQTACAVGVWVFLFLISPRGLTYLTNNVAILFNIDSKTGEIFQEMTNLFTHQERTGEIVK